MPNPPIVSIDRTCIQCGSAFTVRFPSVPSRHCSRSCSSSAVAKRRTGAANSNYRGGKTAHPLYQIYSDMIGRCHRQTHQRHSDYGGRGVKVCTRWRDDFWAFVADVGPRPEGTYPSGRATYSLDRINNNGNYEPGNVQWATSSQQVLNARPSWVRRNRNELGQFA